MPHIVLAHQKAPQYDGSIQAKVYAFLAKLQADDTTSGLHIEPMQQAADPRARTGRVDQFWRAVLFKIDGTEPTYVLEGVYPHDDAIERARTRTLRLNAVNGMPEFLDVDPAVVSAGDSAVERAQRLAAERHREIAAAREKAAAAIAAGLVVEPVLERKGYGLDDLVTVLGFAVADAERLLAAETDVELTGLVDGFENAWQELAVIAMIEGQPVEEIAAMLRGDEPAEAARTSPAPLAPGPAESQPVAPVEAAAEPAEPAGAPSEPAVEQAEPGAIDADLVSDEALLAGLASPAARRQFHYVGDQDELRRAIESSDFGAWTVFLHPDQERYVRSDYRGSFRLTGGAGTGKTVVLLHRARRLALANPQARVVLTTFTRALSRMLRRDLRRLDARVPIAERLGEPGIHIAGVDQLVAAVRTRDERAFEAASHTVLGGSAEHRQPDRDDELAWDEAIEPVADELGDALATRAFFAQEYENVVLPARISERSAYLRASRPGSGHRLGRLQRAAVWQAIEQYRRSRGIDRRISFPELASVAALSLETTGPLADHVLVDEGQDLNPSQWQFLRALAAPGENDLFIAEDSHQRIYGRPVVMSRFGIDLRGRSRRLRLNYRTTQETLDFALRALEGREWLSGEGTPEGEGRYVSARRGPEPRLVEAGSAQGDAIARIVGDWLDEGVPASTIAVLVRRRTEADGLVTAMKAVGITAKFVTPDTVSSAAAVVVMTMHSAKGQEFSRVVLHDLSRAGYPRSLRAGATDAERADNEQQEAALLYVAATRARDELVVTYSGEVTRLLPGVVS